MDTEKMLRHEFLDEKFKYIQTLIENENYERAYKVLDLVARIAAHWGAIEVDKKELEN